MKNQFLNTLPFSFFSYIEHEILDNGEAYYNTSSLFYPVNDNRLSASFKRYSSPFKQFVHDSSVSGANIISGVYINGNFVADGQSGILIDYDNGSVILPSSITGSLTISGDYSVKDFNFYKSNELQDSVITDNKYAINSRFIRTISGIEPYSIVMPAIFITNRYGENAGFALGGTKETTTNITCILAHDRESYLDAGLSLMRDMSEKCFPHLDLSDDPFNEYGGLKTGHYSYQDLSSYRFSVGDYSFVKKVRISKISDSIKANPNLFYGVADFTISSIRHT